MKDKIKKSKTEEDNNKEENISTENTIPEEKKNQFDDDKMDKEIKSLMKQTGKSRAEVLDLLQEEYEKFNGMVTTESIAKLVDKKTFRDKINKAVDKVNNKKTSDDEIVIAPRKKNNITPIKNEITISVPGGNENQELKREFALLNKKEIDGETAIRIALGNDWSQATPELRAALISRLCNILKIPPSMNAFQFIHSKNGMRLYPKKESTDWVAGSLGLSRRIIDKPEIISYGEGDKEEKYVMVKAEVFDKSGRIEQNIGMAPVSMLKGRPGWSMADLIMYTITKAVRRSTLAFFAGLMQDDEYADGSPIR